MILFTKTIDKPNEPLDNDIRYLSRVFCDVCLDAIK